MGIVEMENIISNNEMRSIEDSYNMSVYLLEMVPYFQQNLIFQNIELTRQIAEKMVFRNYKKSDVLVQRGQRVQHVYFLIRGVLMAGGIGGKSSNTSDDDLDTFEDPYEISTWDIIGQ